VFSCFFKSRFVGFFRNFIEETQNSKNVSIVLPPNVTDRNTGSDFNSSAGNVHASRN
jgi:hypothetical protein